MRRQHIGLWATVLAVGATAASARAADDRAAAAFFENRIRPVLAERCYKCHSNRAEKLKAGLRLDSRAGLLAGGDSGPAIEAGHAEKSLLIRAIRYGDIDLQMPPKSKLPEAVIADFERWVAMGAPWPGGGDAPAVPEPEAFDIAKRKAEHWAWQPVRRPTPPDVQGAPKDHRPLDRFLLARLKSAGLSPAPAADRRTLLRRLTFDLTGLPPAPRDIEAFLKDESPDAYEKRVDRLLASPAYGERWARHWMDLVRYAESNGHEFDYSKPDAWRYRDYLIRALNADVPYNDLVTEHIAGDLLPEPRRHPTEGFNESILGTGFWFMGEWVHSPVDIRQDEADRFDNMVDVMGKAFMGLTLGCARCHDHKFDAISAADYYALQGYLQSSNYRLARYESMDHNREIADALAAWRQKEGADVVRATAEAMDSVLSQADAYLLTAQEVLGRGEAVAPVAPRPSILFEDFESGYGDWRIEGDAFGTQPARGTLSQQQAVSGFRGKGLVNSFVKGDRSTGTMTSRPFEIERRAIRFLIGGGAHDGKTCMNLVVDGRTVRTATGSADEALAPRSWDVTPWLGRQARLQIVDRHRGGWGHVNVDHIEFVDDAAGVEPDRALTPVARRRLKAAAEQRRLNPAVLQAWAAALEEAAHATDDPLHAFARAARASDVSTALRPAIEGLLRESAQADDLGPIDNIVDYATAPPEDFIQDGVSFVQLKAGRPVFGTEAARPVLDIARRGAAWRNPIWNKLKIIDSARDAGSGLGNYDRSGKTLRTPTFELKHDRVHYLVRGKGRAFACVDSHRMVQGPLHGNVVMGIDTKGRWQVVSHVLSRYTGHRFHVEFTPESEAFEVARVFQGGDAEDHRALLAEPNAALATALGEERVQDLKGLAAAYGALFARVGAHLKQHGRVPSGGEAALAGWMLNRSDLFLASEDRQKLEKRVAPAIERRNALISKIRHESRTAMAMMDGSAENEYEFIRGSWKKRGEVVPRRFLEALGGQPGDAPAAGSGRLQLARQMTDPHRNPFISRVIVNRIWHHLMGRGIVASTDDFGVLGMRPTHPELLDHLASRFVEEDGWSIKSHIKRVVMSSAYRMSSAARDPNAESKDPKNLLWHRAPVKRLEGEAIRDAILAVSGRLDASMHGPSVPVHLTSFMTGRGRPKGGPLDGDGRRSVYVAVRRNFLPPMMLAFDTPIPFNTIGRRTVSNVPAQALILMNDPFVAAEARRWAEAVLQSSSSPTERVDRMYEQAYGRPPTEAERRAAVAFVSEQPDSLDVWADLAHTLFNVKEFIYIR